MLHMQDSVSKLHAQVASCTPGCKVRVYNLCLVLLVCDNSSCHTRNVRRRTLVAERQRSLSPVASSQQSTKISTMRDVLATAVRD